MAAYTGLRLAELVALRWRDVDFATASCTSRNRSPPARSSTPPRAAGHRSVPLSDRAAAALNNLSAEATSTGPDGYTAIPRRRQHRRRRPQPTHGRRRDHAGLRKLTWHQLRHTFAHARGRRRRPCDDPGAMGHSKITTTQI